MFVPALRIMILVIAGVLTGPWLVSVCSAQSIYKWVGDDGSVHYADHPPPEAIETQKLAKEPAPSEDVVRDALKKRDRLKDEQQTFHQQRMAVRDQERKQSDSDQAQQDRRQKRCTKAQEEIQSLNHHIPVYYLDESGNRVFLDDKSRSELIGFYEREIAMFCE